MTSSCSRFFEARLISPGLVYEPFVLGKELIQIIDRVGKFMQELRLSWRSLALLDEVQDVNWRPISLEKIIKMQGCGRVEWVDKVELDAWLG